MTAWDRLSKQKLTKVNKTAACFMSTTPPTIIENTTAEGKQL